jgi:hypothetical protein
MSQMANLTVSNETLDLSAEMGPAFTVRTVIGPSFQLSMSSTSEFALTVGTKTSSLFAGGGEQGPRGLTGPEGPQGIQGIQGVQGPIGPQGIQGIKGDRGLKGDIGVTGADSIIPGPTGPQGLTGARGLTGADSTVVGPTGPQGNQGPQGLKGNTGDQGIAGVSNTPGPIGPAGPIGPMGPTGNTGAKGDLGYSMRSGTVAPTSGQFNIGDFYVNTLNLYLYGPKTVSGWGTPISIKGATGNNGEGILHGTLNPTNQGDTGDFYLRTTDYTLFGPKASGTWPAGISLIGPQGPVGPAGASSNIAGPIGPQGVQGIAGVSNVPGPTGPTGPIGSTGLTGPTGAASTVAGPTGPAGTNGTNGTNGIDGTGVVIGGTAGQLLSKIDATDYNVQWIDAPTGGDAPSTYETPSYANTYGSGNRTSFVTATFSGTNNGPISTLFNGLTDNAYWWGSNPVLDKILLITFADPQYVTEMNLAFQAGYNFGTWRIEASNDLITWDVMNPSAAMISPSAVMTLPNAVDTTGYIYYRLVGLTGLTSTGPYIHELTFKTGGIAPPVEIVPLGGTTGQLLSKIDNTDYNLQWIDAATGGGGGGSTGITVPNVSAKFWRIKINANNGDNTYTVLRAQVYDADGVEISLGAVSYFASSMGSATVEQGFGPWAGDSGAVYWSSAANATYPQYVGFELASPAAASYFTASGVRDITRNIKDFQWEYSDDGVTYTAIGYPVVNQTAWALGGVDVRSFDFDNIGGYIAFGLKTVIGNTISLSTTLNNNHFSGSKFIDVSAEATITIPSGLTGTEPVTFQQTGFADVTFAAGAGVTIQSFTSKLLIAGQFASVTLVPKGGDVYGLIGALK